jgi:hypothetical protein
MDVDSVVVERLRRELTSIDPAQVYFAFARLEVNGRPVTSVQSCFAGWPDGRGPGAVELRQAVPVAPEVMLKLWQDLREQWIAVSTPEHLHVYLLAGGNALVEQSLAERYFGDLVKPHLVVRSGPLGFEGFDPNARAVRCRRPRPKQRRRVLARDHHKCQLCGAQEDDGADLTLHHIRMFSRGGPTTDENLITLCKPCHDALDPHEDETLFSLPGGHIDRALALQSAEEHGRAVASYRSKMADVVASLRSEAAST